MNLDYVNVNELYITNNNLIVPEIIQSFYGVNLKSAENVETTPDTSKLSSLIQTLNQDSGKCLGELNILQVSKVNNNGLSYLSSKLDNKYSLVIWEYQGMFTNDFISENMIYIARIPTSKVQHLINIDEKISPKYSEICNNEYSNKYNWDTKYGINHIKGTNDFPTMGWTGGFFGTTLPLTKFLQNTKKYVFPFTFLPLNTLSFQGTIMSGQIVQYNNSLSLIPYQQGKGSVDYIVREPIYENNVAESLDIVTSFPPEGAVAGRNNAFVGVAITDYKDSLNIKNHQKGSLTFNDIRSTIQYRKSHPSPLTIDVSEVDRPLPWTNVWNYSSNENINILSNGITPLTIAGAYPLYRGSWDSEYSGRIPRLSLYSSGRWLSKGSSQYYTTTEFWDPSEDEPSISIDLSTLKNPIDPKNPFKIKGAKIELLEGQRVIAGSYVYSTASMVGNVNIMKFYPDSAKEIFLPDGQILQPDPYSRYQSNQGSLIVSIVEDGKDPPMPISNAQPIGIILETVEGEGSLQELEYGTPERVKDNEISEDLQGTPIDSKTISNSDVNVWIFPMYSQLWSSGIPGTYGIQGLPYGSTVGTRFITDEEDFWTDPTIYAPRYEKIRNNYIIPDSPYAWSYALEETIINSDRLNIFGTNRAQQYTLTSREGGLDWPYPQCSIDSKQTPEL